MSQQLRALFRSDSDPESDSDPDFHIQQSPRRSEESWKAVVLGASIFKHWEADFDEMRSYFGLGDGIQIEKVRSLVG